MSSEVQEAPSNPRKLLTRAEAAELLGTTVGTLNVWACRGTGPAFIRIGRAVRYRQSDLDSFLANHRVSTRDQN